AADALVAQAENAFAVGDDDHLHVVLGGSAQNVVYVGVIRVGYEDAAMTAVDAGEFLTGLADRGSIDDRQHFLEMIFQQAEEQRFVVVLNGAQQDVPVQIRLAQAVLMVGPVDLLLDRLHGARQQADQVEVDALVEGEGAALVQQRQLQQGRSGIGYVQRALASFAHVVFVSAANGVVRQPGGTAAAPILAICTGTASMPMPAAPVTDGSLHQR